MPKPQYRKPFLKALIPLWTRRLPEWKHGIWSCPLRAPKDSTFTNTSLLAGYVFHAVIDFTPNKTGAFTADILVTTSLDPLPPSFIERWPQDLQALTCGSYRIGFFVKGQDIWWRLVNEGLRFSRLLAQLPGVDPSAMSWPHSPHDWFASSYDLPLPEIIQEAALHFTDTFERHVPAQLRRNS